MNKFFVMKNGKFDISQEQISVELFEQQTCECHSTKSKLKLKEQK